MLEWQLRNSDKLRHLENFKKKRDAGEKIPFLETVPEPLPVYYWIWEGFGVLAGQRMIGDNGNIQPIQISEIKAYAEYTGIEDEGDREDFLRVVLALDRVAIDFAQKRMNAHRQKQQNASKGAGPKSGRRRR